MRKPLSKSLRGLSRAVKIEDRGELSFAGRPVPVPHPAAPSRGPAPEGLEERTSSLPAPAVSATGLPEDWEASVEALQMELYQHGYCRPFEGCRVEEPSPVAPDPAFLRYLEAANTGTDRVESDWTVRNLDSTGRLLAEKKGRIRSFQPGEYTLPTAGVSPGPGSPGPGSPGPVSLGPVSPGLGSPVEVKLKKGSPDLQPGFYVVFGDAIADPQDGSLGALRLYFNIRASGAPALVRAVTEHLNRFQVPFSFKTLAVESYYQARADSAVLFLHRRFFPIAAHLAVDLRELLGEDLEAPVPLFSRAVVPGIGLAEDPGSGDSFGLSRCRLVSEGLFLAHQRGATSLKDRLAAVEERFESVGISFDHPYLNARSVDRYELPLSEGGPA